MSTLIEVFNNIDDVKQKLSEQEYITISNLLKKCHEENEMYSSISSISKHISNMNLNELENIQTIIKTRKKNILRANYLGFSIGQKVKIVSSSNKPERTGVVYRLHKNSLDILLSSSIVRKISPEEIQAL